MEPHAAEPLDQQSFLKYEILLQTFNTWNISSIQRN